MRWRSSLTLLVLLTWVGCTSSDGQPWGQLEAELGARLSDVDGRLTEEGDVLTTRQYAVRIESLSLDYDALTVRMRGADGQAFDPADPPAGCSLCHNGHCHCGGALVAYEDLALQAGGAGAEVTLGAAGATTLALDETAAVGLDDCGDCALPRGELSAVEVRVSRLRARLVVRDLGEDARLVEPRAIELDLPLSLVADLPIEGAFDRESPVGLRLAVTHEISVKWFDRLEWDAPEEVLIATLRERLAEASALRADTTRFDP